ncbi:hypothetical protein [Paenisporosarcina cavernae]|nr:hypothetical protein [Paenisporosarcina cavernae]
MGVGIVIMMLLLLYSITVTLDKMTEKILGKLDEQNELLKQLIHKKKENQ